MTRFQMFRFKHRRFGFPAADAKICRLKASTPPIEYLQSPRSQARETLGVLILFLLAPFDTFIHYLL